jgi:hypothetical protein
MSNKNYYPINGMNGKAFFEGKDTYSYKTDIFNNYPLIKEPDNYNEMSKLGMKGESIKATDTTDNLSKIFFSPKNIQRIQKKIKEEVFKRTNGKFRLDEDQDENSLLIMMRAYYLDNSRFLSEKPIRYVKLLNKGVIGFVVPDIITNIKQAYSYQLEINQPIKPIDRPINMNSAGRRTLPSVTTTWHL